jgi:AcrR family transcriptional regulator
MGKPHAQRKAEIISSALELAAEVGVKKVTTQAIADRVGIAQATVFRHFKSRDLIFSEAIEWLAGQLFEVLSGCFNDKTLSADDRLNMLINKQLGFIAQHKGLPRLLFSDRLHIESPALKGVARNIMKRYTQRLATLIDEGIAAGCFKKGIDPFETATMVTALIQGSVMRWSIYDFEFKLEDEAEPILRFLSKILCEKQI